MGWGLVFLAFVALIVWLNVRQRPASGAQDLQAFDARLRTLEMQVQLLLDRTDPARPRARSRLPESAPAVSLAKAPRIDRFTYADTPDNHHLFRPVMPRWDFQPRLLPGAAPAASAKVAGPARIAPPAAEPVSFERRIGERWLIWLGAIAIIIGGVLLVGMGFSANVLGPGALCAIGMMLGIGLVCGGVTVSKLPAMANGARISQALAGAGLALLYGVCFGANSAGLVSDGVGFIGLLIVTGVTVALAPGFGAGLTLLAMAGGFAAPGILGRSDSNGTLLFLYLFAMIAGMAWQNARHQWWILQVPLMIGGWLWAAAWLTVLGHPESGFVVGLFLIGCCGVMLASLAEVTDEAMPLSTETLRRILVTTTALLLCLALSGASVTPLEMSLPWLLISAGCFLTWINPPRFGYAPLLGLAAACFTLVVYANQSLDAYGIGYTAQWQIVFFAVLYAIAGLAGGAGLLAFERRPLIAAGLAAATPLVMQGTVMLCLSAFAKREPGMLDGMVAAGWAILLFFLCQWRIGVARAKGSDMRIAGLLLAGALGGLVMALGCVVPSDHWALTAAGLTLALVLAERRLGLPWPDALIKIGYALTALCLLPYLVSWLMLLIQAGQSIPRLPLAFDSPLLVLVDLGGTALLLAAAAWWSRDRVEAALTGLLAASVPLVLACAAHLFVVSFGCWTAADGCVRIGRLNFLPMGVILACWFGITAGTLWVDRKAFPHPALRQTGLGLTWGLAVVTVLLPLLLLNPLLVRSGGVGPAPLFNGITLVYGGAAVGFWWLRRELLRDRPDLPGAQAFAWFSILLAFIWLNLTVRQLLHGSDLVGRTGQGELLIYSALWLLVGVGLLPLARRFDSLLLRRLSLGLVLLATGKVFILDLAALGGALRVLSFIGLGLVLIALGWYYSRFVFTEQPRRSDEPTQP